VWCDVRVPLHFEETSNSPPTGFCSLVHVVRSPFDLQVRSQSNLKMPLYRMTNLDYSGLQDEPGLLLLPLQCSSWNLWTQFQVRARSTWSPQLNSTPTAVDPDRNLVDHSSWSRLIWFSTMFSVLRFDVWGHFDYCYSRECWYRFIRMIRSCLDGCELEWWCDPSANCGRAKMHRKSNKNGKNPYPIYPSRWFSAMAESFGCAQNPRKTGKKIKNHHGKD